MFMIKMVELYKDKDDKLMERHFKQSFTRKKLAEDAIRQVVGVMYSYIKKDKAKIALKLYKKAELIRRDPSITKLAKRK